MTAKKPTEADLRVVVRSAYRQHGHERFSLPSGPVGAALDAAQRKGWVWMPRPGVACVTLAGAEAVGAREPAC